MLIAVTMSSHGIFDFDQTLMVIYGAHAGSSLNTWITGIHFRGQPRQIVTAQILSAFLEGVGGTSFLVKRSSPKSEYAY